MVGLSLSVSQRGNPANEQDNNQDPNATGETKQTIQGTYLKHPAQDIKETTQLGLTEILPPKATSWKSKQICQIHRNKQKRDSSNGETKKQPPNKRKESPEKELN